MLAPRIDYQNGLHVPGRRPFAAIHLADLVLSGFAVIVTGWLAGWLGYISRARWPYGLVHFAYNVARTEPGRGTRASLEPGPIQTTQNETGPTFARYQGHVAQACKNDI